MNGLELFSSGRRRLGYRQEQPGAARAIHWQAAQGRAAYKWCDWPIQEGEWGMGDVANL
jgi:hypothetical protein